MDVLLCNSIATGLACIVELYLYPTVGTVLIHSVKHSHWSSLLKTASLAAETPAEPSVRQIMSFRPNVLKFYPKSYCIRSQKDLIIFIRRDVAARQCYFQLSASVSSVSYFSHFVAFGRSVLCVFCPQDNLKIIKISCLLLGSHILKKNL